MIFETERLFARRWTLDDAESAFRMYGDPEVMRFLGRAGSSGTLKSLDEMRERLTLLIEKFKEGGSFDRLFHAPLVLKETGEIVGTTLLTKLPDAEMVPTEDVEVGWHLIPEHWGKGYATESGRGAIEYAFKNLDIDEINAVVYSENLASRRVMDRLGMTHVGKTDKYYGVEVERYVLKRPA